MKYLNTSGRQITVNVLDKKAGKVVKTILIPGKPIDVDQSIMDKARKESVVVSHYFKSGEIVKFNKQNTVEDKTVIDDDKTGSEEGSKAFMLEALQASGIDEYTKFNGRNSEKSVKEAFDKMIAEAGGSDNNDEAGGSDTGDGDE